ncbi:hypothetical protein RD792_006197 [Penstemon davidsonii]|uniref:Uncharacterized protein n=1 Tax=Penstemon davidsonii TaxID=160366 RepID=A0ABR0DCA6_9LAMI|nr:hypothetical protein RD792_006197 [Penstemon davidsonii]
MTTLLQNLQIPPSPEAAATELSLPLAFFDIPWLHFHPIRRLIFYEFPSGNLLYPVNTENKPIIRFTPGDSVLLTVAESNNDFDNLIGNHARDADQFYAFVPELPLKEGPEYKSVPVVAVKVTLFLGRGICIGFANLHSLGDASSIVGFIRAWAEISKFGGDEEYLIKQVDCRSRITPPLPSNYFGNCLGYGIAKIKNRELVKNDGFVLAAKTIADDIKNRVNNKDEVLKDVENWMSDFSKLIEMRVLGISGSPKFDLYSTDFGWGKARKVEAVTIDGEKYSMALCKSREFEGGLEVGWSLPKERMETFAAIFADGLNFLRLLLDKY